MIKIVNQQVETIQKGMQQGLLPQPLIIVIFGASGDLTHKELIPSLYALKTKRLLPEKFAIIGFARREWSDNEFRKEMHKAVKGLSEYNLDTWKEFAQKLFYIVGDFNDAASKSYSDLNNKISELQKENEIKDNLLFHLSVPPDFYGTIIKKLDTAGLAKSSEGWRRVIIEKPFGKDERSARELDEEIREIFNEDQVFRIDHYLGKETVQNMLCIQICKSWLRTCLEQKLY